MRFSDVNYPLILTQVNWIFNGKVVYPHCPFSAVFHCQIIVTEKRLSLVICKSDEW